MGVESWSSSIVSVLYELLFCCLLSFVLESRNLKMKIVLLLFAMIVVAFGQEADEGWEETPPADPPVEENKYKTDKYGKKPYGYKPRYDHKPKYGYQPPKPYGYQPPKPYGGYGYKKPVHGGYGNYGYKPTYGHDSYGYQTPTYGQESYGSPTPTYGHESYGYPTPTYGQESYGYQTPTYGQDSYGYQKPTYGGYDNYGYKSTYGHDSYGYQKQMYGGYQKHGYGNSYGYKKPYGKKYDSSHVDNTIKKVGEYADAQEDYKTQSLNVKYSYDAVPTEYDYVEKYGWGRPTTIGSLYNGYGNQYPQQSGYGNQYPQQYGYGQQDSYGYKRPSYGYKRPSYGYKKPSYCKRPYGYKSKYGKKPKEDQDWEEPKEETHEDGDWKDDTDKDWEE